MMEYLGFEIETDYHKNTILIILTRNVQSSEQRWLSTSKLLSRSVPISGFLNNPHYLLDRVIKAQLDMLKWYDENHKMVDAIEMLTLNTKSIRIAPKDLKRKDLAAKMMGG